MACEQVGLVTECVKALEIQEINLLIFLYCGIVTLHGHPLIDPQPGGTGRDQEDARGRVRRDLRYILR